MDTDGTVRHHGLDHHGMGTVFEELIRRFNEENNEEAGEHFTPRDAVELMAKLVFLPIAHRIESATYLLYDGACGTGGMLTMAEEVLQQIAKEQGKTVSTHLYGQEVRVWGDAGYRGMEKREVHEDRQVAWHIAMGPSQRRRLARDGLERLMEACKSSVRAKVEQVFFYVKQMFGYGKVRYRSLAKNENRLALLLGFANLLRAESCMV